MESLDPSSLEKEEMSKLDQLYRRLLLTKFFVKGWGNPDSLKRIFEFRKVISCRETCRGLVSPDHPVIIDEEKSYKDHKIIDGHFRSPLADHMPGIMPKETEIARFQMILPSKWKTKHKPVCIHLAGTGDHYFWRRRALLARPLSKESGIASILLENPYYGYRKPKQQLRSSLHNVSDLFVMGGALVLESLVLLHWCTRQGFGPLGLTGISMGGHMASLAATNWHLPIVLVPCLSWSTASVVFTEGVMSGAIPWKLLKQQYTSEASYSNDLLKLINSPEKNINNREFHLGTEFVKNYPTSVENLQNLHESLTVDNIHKTTQHIEFQTSSMLTSLSTLRSLLHKILQPLRKPFEPTDTPLDDQEALNFMRGVMDECTHLGNFSVPVDPTMVVIVVAKSDAYYPRTSVLGLNDLWPGAEVRYVNTGHISAFLFKQGVFRKAITDAFDKYLEKYTN